GPRSFTRSDDRVKEDVCERLTRHSAIDAADIEVEVKEGEVTLSGSVPERRMKHLAEDCCEHCYGVKEVTNNIRVKKEASPSSSSDYSSSDRSSDSSRSATDRTGASAAAKKSSSSSTSTTSNPNH
ncbi:MAG: BON domain-containing protein, partial [Bdellovibrio sp.]